MDAVRSAASVIAVRDLSAKVALLCFQYSAKNARSDIERLQGELSLLKGPLQGALQLLDSPLCGMLQPLQGLDGLGDCSSQLAELQLALEMSLNPGYLWRVMRKFGIRAPK